MKYIRIHVYEYTEWMFASNPRAVEGFCESVRSVETKILPSQHDGIQRAPERFDEHNLTASKAV